MSRYRAKWHDTPARVFKSQSDAGKLTHTSLLSYPCTDLAGDYVVGSGCDFAPHQACPEIDFEHRRHPEVKGMPVAWARESLSEPGAPYSVRMVRLNFAEDGQPADYHTVPVGTEYFDKSCPVSMQVFALRESGALPASSLEFEMLPAFAKAIGWSALEGRKAYRFEKCRVHRWTVCGRGVNPGALVLEKSVPSGVQVPTGLDRILTDRRVNVGGRYEPLHGYILKALAPAGAEHTKRTAVRVEKGVEQPRDENGRWASTGGGKMPHVHSTPQHAKEYAQHKQAGLHNLTRTKVEVLARKTGAPKEQVQAELDAHAGHGPFPHIHTTPEQVARYKQWREMGTHNLADSQVESIARKHGVNPETVAAELNHHAATATEKKAMNDEYDDPQLQSANEAQVTGEAAEMPGAGDGVAHNGVTALYAHADGIVQLCDQLDADLEKTDSAELYKEGQKLCEMARALAEKVKAAGDKHDKKLQAMKGKGEAPAEPAEGEEPAESADMTPDEDEEGTFKAVRRVYKPILKALRVKRFKAAEVDAAALEQKAEDEGPPTAAELLERYKNDPAVAREVHRLKLIG